MKKTKLLTLVFAVLALSTLLIAAMGVCASAAMADFNAIEEPVPDKNLLPGSDFERDPSYYDWKAETGVKGTKTSLEIVKTSTGSYLQHSKILVNYQSITFSNPNRAIIHGKYKFTGYFRMMYEDEITGLRLQIYDYEGKKIAEPKVYPVDSEWMKVEVYFEIPYGSMFGKIAVCGMAEAGFVQPYCLDNFSLVAVDEIPEGYVMPTEFGNRVSSSAAVKSQKDSLFYYPKYDQAVDAELYDVQGIIMNFDADHFLTNIGTKAELEEYARGYAGSHVTDFMLCVNNTCATYPSKVWTSLTDKYDQKIENGIAVDYSEDAAIKGAYTHFITKKQDYFKIFCQTFKEVGINPWISFRMNDSHDITEKTSKLLSDFFHENPQIRRVHHKDAASTSDKYYWNSKDYTHELVREHMLALINEALGRYDCYGIELDWQRDIYLWHHGGEYNGLDILTEFMREVERVVAVYENKYKHEIKICVRVASDIETNYACGLDVLTWASEGIIDLVIPTSRWATLDITVPVGLWTSVMHPYGVEVAPCIEARMNVKGSEVTTTGHQLTVYNGAAAAFLSQGADKVAMYNFYISGVSTRIQDKHKVTTDDEEVGGTWRHWVIISTIGSYDKLMTKDRRVILTYNDIHQIWEDTKSQLPQSCAVGESVVVHIPIGDVAPGSKVTLKIGVSAANISKRPTVYVNSQIATWSSLEMCDGGYSNYQLLTYSVPEAALNSPYLTVEIVPQRALNMDYAEVTIEVAK